KGEQASEEEEWTSLRGSEYIAMKEREREREEKREQVRKDDKKLYCSKRKRRKRSRGRRCRKEDSHHPSILPSFLCERPSRVAIRLSLWVISSAVCHFSGVSVRKRPL
ncbi:hypothetical protein ALC57_07150, partial [Trachymyrmex cornetzi]